MTHESKAKSPHRGWRTIHCGLPRAGTRRLKLPDQIITAFNGREALAKIHNEQPDLVLLDLRLPVLDGFAALAQLKADSLLRDIAVIILSAEQDSKSVVEGIKQGAEAYLTKPLNADLLMKKLKEYLG